MSFVFDSKGSKNKESGLSRSPADGIKDFDTHFFLGKKVKIKKHDGIYSIIKRQKRRNMKNTGTEIKSRRKI